MEAKFKFYFKVAKKNAKKMRNLKFKTGIDSPNYAWILNLSSLYKILVLKLCKPN